MGTPKRCTKCSEEFPYTSEYFPSNGSGKLRPSCRKCESARAATVRQNAPLKKCGRCGREFPAYRHDLLYCSQKCRRAGTKTTTKLCPECGNAFTVNASIANRYTHCSDECKRARTLYCICQRCGKSFRGDKRYPRYYCSEECRRPPVHIECKTCGKRVRAQPGDTDRQFCSFACYRKSQTETLLEYAVRIALEALDIAHSQEAKFGRYSVDFFLPDLQVALEADGAYWHRDPARDLRKTAYLQRRGLKVCRISDQEVAGTPNLCNLLLEKLTEATGVTFEPMQLRLL